MLSNYFPDFLFPAFIFCQGCFAPWTIDHGPMSFLKDIITGGFLDLILMLLKLQFKNVQVRSIQYLLIVNSDLEGKSPTHWILVTSSLSCLKGQPVIQSQSQCLQKKQTVQGVH